MRTRKTDEAIVEALKRGPVHANDFVAAFKRAGGVVYDKWTRTDALRARDRMVEAGAILLAWDAEGWPIYRLAQ